MYKAGHIVPTPQVQAKDMVAQVVKKLFHLKCKGMRLDQCHAFDIVRWQPASFRKRLKQVAPPDCFFSRFRLRDVNRQRVFKAVDVYAINKQGRVEERSGHQLAGEKSCLTDVKTTYPGEDNGIALPDADTLVAL